MPAPPRGRQRALGGTLTLALADFAADRLQSILITRAAPTYQAVTGVLVHALTNGFFWLAAWLMAGGCALAGVIAAASLFRRTGRRTLPLHPGFAPTRQRDRGSKRGKGSEDIDFDPIK